MSVFIVTGKLGSGKTLVAVGLIRDALIEGRKVATNVDLWLDEMLGWQNKKAEVYRLPDQLSAKSFQDIGGGNDHIEVVRGRNIYDEKKNGLIVLDEGGLSMNSRDYREEGRKEFIKWCIHSRKRGWDIAIIVQHFDTLDKQIRDMFGEMVVYCMRFDRLRLPFIGGLLQAVGLGGNMAQVHMAVCKYGSKSDSPVAWRKTFRGRDLWFSYDTRQQYFPSDGEAVYQLLPPYYTKGRYKDKKEAYQTLLREIYDEYLGIKMGKVLVFFSAMILGIWIHSKWVGDETLVRDPQQQKQIQNKNNKINDYENGFSLEELYPDEEYVDENAVEMPENPWLSAYISTFLQVGNGQSVYKFRSRGFALPRPVGAAVIGLSKCHAVVKFDGQEFHVFCR